MERARNQVNDAEGDTGSAAPPAPSARRVALDLLDRIESEGAYANLAVPQVLDRSRLEPRDRRFVTELVYGTTRMRRACDWLVDRHVERSPSARVRNALRLGAYQVAFAGVAAHAAVAETVAVSPRPARGLVNAVLRRVASAKSWDRPGWPDDATRLSVPDWVLTRLSSDLGREPALAALAAMNTPAAVVERPDGYVQDPASQEVVAAMGPPAGQRVLDLCAAPGGKATALAAAGAQVVAADVHPARVGLVRGNAVRVGVPERVDLVAADGTLPPFLPASFDRVLVDAPCSGLGTLRRRPDLRWRVEPSGVEQLARLQRRLVDAAADLVRPGGALVYSVCTLTAAETHEIDAWLAEQRPDLVAEDVAGDPPGAGWERWGRGAILLPQTRATDGMFLSRYRLPVT